MDTKIDFNYFDNLISEEKDKIKNKDVKLEKKNVSMKTLSN